MANDKNKIKELVSDDEDPTVELEVFTFHDDEETAAAVQRESDANTFGLEDHSLDSTPANQSIAELRSDLQSRAKTIGRLQRDIEQLRSKWLGLETEIKAREAIVGKLSQDIADLRDTVGRKEKLLKKRDTTIRALKSEIRQRDEAHRELARQHDELQQSLDRSVENAGDHDAKLQAAQKDIEALREQVGRERANKVVDTNEDPALRELQSQLSRTEHYADDLRIKLKDITESHDDLSRDRERLTRNLSQAAESNRQLTADLAASRDEVDQVRAEIDDLRKAHEEEIRILRFELDEAQNTVAETSDLNSQLASDLLDTRGYKDELERMLCDNEEQSQRRIEKLERNLDKLARSAEDYEQKLESKAAAINVLLGELAKKSEQIEAIGEIEEVIQDIDDRMSERIDDIDVDEAAETSVRLAGKQRDKVTRVLIGRIGDQVLRFPLFKDRLTIGRTEDNDIQLKLSYISRRHAVVMTEGDTTRVIDWGSKNGVYVNSKRIKEHFLSNGDIVAVGNAKFRYEERKKRES